MPRGSPSVKPRTPVDRALRNSAESQALVINRILPVVAHAVAVFGDEHKASHWMETRLALLRNRTPAETLATDGGIEAVERILTRIEHNIPS